MRNTTTIQSGYHLIFRHLFSVCLACLSVLLICTLSHAAGINTDGSMGSATTLTGPNYTIPPELGQQKGSNLFHSFGYFSVRNGEKATFTTDPRYITNNIIGRVTGGEQSEIYGSLICKTAGTNLWLLNPAGILFGAGASLDVQGSFHASTADSLQLSDGGVFYTDPSKTSKLTTAAPSAFGFLSSKSKEITISGSNLTVESGKTLSLIGGNINIVNGQLIAPSGKINLVSLASPGEVVLNEDGIAVTGSPELGDIRISTTSAASTVSQPEFGRDESKDEMILEQSGFLRNKLVGQASSSLIDVSGSKEDATSGGSVDIYCKKFSLDNSGINSDNYSNYKGGKIRLVAEESVSIGNLSAIYSRNYGEGVGAGGDIDIQTGYLALTNVGQINAFTYGGGNGGDVIINAKDILIDAGPEISNSAALSQISCTAKSGSKGNAGSLNIDTGSVTLSNSGLIGAVTLGSGSGGDITIKAKDVSINGGFESSKSINSMIACQTQSAGNAGSLNIDTESLTLSNGGQIGASTSGSGYGGNVTIKAKDVLIDGSFETSKRVYLSMIACQTKSAGNAGSLNIDTESLTLSNGAEISAATFKSGYGGKVTIKAKDVSIDGGFESSEGFRVSRITSQTNTDSTGNAGNLNIDTELLTLSNGGQIDAGTLGSGKGGDVTIKAKYVSIDGGFSVYSSMVTCQTESAGNAGSVNIDTESLTLSNGGRIMATTFGSGKGGDITIKANDVSIDGGFESSNDFYPSMITCQAAPGSTGNAGSLHVDTESLTLYNGGQISASTFGSGKGGDITIKANDVSIDGGFESSEGFYLSMIACQTNPGSTGDSGSLNIDTESLTLSNGGRISASTYGIGNAGDVTIKAKDVSIDGGFESSNGLYPSTINCIAGRDSGGKAGNISLQANTLSMSNGGAISVKNSGKKPGGSIDINVANLTMNSGAVISSASTGTGDAGSINLTIADKLESRNSTITTESTQADGGNITITITNTGFLTYLINSSITATVGGGPQTTGGNIRINSPYVVLKDSHVIANAYEGKGGNIGITADTYLADWTSTVSASSALGISGQVDINSPLVNLSGLLSPLPTTFADITELLADDCETRYKYRKVSSLVVRGRDALPAQPGDLWPSPVMMR